MQIQNLRIPFIAITLLGLTACQPSSEKGGIAQGIDQAQKSLQQASTQVENAKQKLAQAQRKIQTDNISLGDDGSNLPKAELAPDGQLLIDGKPVTMTSEQKSLALAYRRQLQNVASDGVSIGMAGAKLGIDAAAGALKDLLGGQTADAISKRAETAVQQTIQPKVQQLCARLPEVLKAQNDWAAVQPEFRPYATMDQTEVDNCMDKKVANS